MEAGKASRSAMGSGLLRAAHVREDPPPWVLEDTLAGQLLDAAEVAELEAAMADWPPAVRQAFRVSHAVRARLAEDVAAAGLAAGRRDYVLLGAGLDTFAWRHPRAGDFVVWEIDHPDTQAWKRAALRRAGLAEPANIRFVAADLSATAIGDLRTPARATWNWLGVTMYLQPEATAAALRAIAAGRTGTTLVVNFLLAAGTLDALGHAVRDSAAAAVAAAGEPVVATYTPDEAAGLLGEAGFGSIELFDAGRLRDRYLRNRPELPLPGTTLIAVAAVQRQDRAYALAWHPMLTPTTHQRRSQPVPPGLHPRRQALRTAAVVRLLLHNALRVDEACAADVADLGEDSGHRVLRVVRKGARRAKIPLTPATVPALEASLAARAERAGAGEWRQLSGPLVSAHRARARATGSGSSRTLQHAGLLEPAVSGNLRRSCARRLA